MNYLEWFITHPVEAFILLFIQFAVLMVTRPKWEKTVLKKPLIIWFAWQDLLMNWMMILLFLDKPMEWNELVTGRMQRYLGIKLDRDSQLIDSWRYYFAVSLCWALLKFDPNHFKN